ncbi:MAG: HAMP domain-containing histidine kinase [Candidatus Jacksonbacteria bacterium]|nr:HAMP domain-containing histidine kinase [Candidatus Jacksonbacteria bacterium]
MVFHEAETMSVLGKIPGLTGDFYFFKTHDILISMLILLASSLTIAIVNAAMAIVFFGKARERKRDFVKLSEEHELLLKSVKRKKRQLLKFKEMEKREARFISMLRHELRTPLTVIIWTIKTLMGNDECTKDNSVKEMLQDGYNATQTMLEKIDDFLGVLKINPNSIKLTRRFISLNRMIADILKRYEEKIRDKKLHVSFHEKKFAMQFIGDKHLIYEALRHIVSNAVFYTPDKGSIKIRVDEQNDCYLIKVADTGIGIKEDDAEKLYQKYYRGKNAITMKPDSSGLGLYVTRPIIRAHKGEIWFESVHGKGTTFFVRLPKTLSTFPSPETNSIKK